MNPFVSSVIGSGLRWGLGLVAGYLVSTGALTEGDATKFVAALVTSLTPIIWSLISQFQNRQKIVTALAAPHPLTEVELAEIIARGRAASVLTPQTEVPVQKPAA